MIDETRVSKPNNMKFDAASRVAYELMQVIDSHAEKGVKKNERYYLMLYRHAWRVVHGQPIDTVLQEQ